MPTPIHLPKCCPSCGEPFNGTPPGEVMEFYIEDLAFDEGNGGAVTLWGWSCPRSSQKGDHLIYGTVVKARDGEGNITEMLSTDHSYLTDLPGREWSVYPLTDPTTFVIKTN